MINLTRGKVRYVPYDLRCVLLLFADRVPYL